MISDSAKAGSVATTPEGVSDRSEQYWVELAVVTVITLLWLQLYYTVTPVWLHGDYYDYGWFVPPLAGFFFFRRWSQRPKRECRPLGRAELWMAASLLFPLLVCIRALEGFDPSWRPPMILHAAIVAALSHWLIWRRCGKAVSLSMIPVTVFALSAVPYPYQLEHAVIQGLTEWVVRSAGTLFQLVGRPVLVNGGIIEYAGTKVEVTDGCSGIQSLQSLIMVSLYLGEFFRVRTPRRFMLVGFAVVVALTVNVGRAIYLARVRFDQGEAAFESAHDGVGHTAFIIGGLSLLLITRIVMNLGDGKRKTLRRTLKKNS